MREEEEERGDRKEWREGRREVRWQGEERGREREGRE